MDKLERLYREPQARRESVLRPGDTCTKAGQLFREVLQKRTPPLQEIDAANPIKSTFEFYEEVPDAVPIDISGSYVDVVARHIGGAGIP